jgi:hypothetical protein
MSASNLEWKWFTYKGTSRTPAPEQETALNSWEAGELVFCEIHSDFATLLESTKSSNAVVSAKMFTDYVILGSR